MCVGHAPTDSVEEEKYLKNGSFQLIEREYYVHGGIKNDYYFIDDELKLIRNYYKNGKIKSEQIYQNGEILNLKNYKENGELEMDVDIEELQRVD